MTLTYSDWAKRHPQAARELQAVVAPGYEVHDLGGSSEAYVQQQGRMAWARMGNLSWRNNVGGTRAKQQHSCPKCNFRFQVEQQPIRYGLANETPMQNQLIKSGDTVGIRKVFITQEMVGTVIGQFASIEYKAAGWQFNPNDPHEAAQMAWANLINSNGGWAVFNAGGPLL